MEYYVYVWRDSAGVPFYVGKGKDNRANITHRRSPEFMEIHAQGGCTVEIVDWFIHESQAHAHEVDLIDRYGRREYGGTLINKTDGGEGISGYVHTDDARESIGAASREAWADEDRRNDRAANIKASLSRPDTRALLSRAQKRLWADPVRRNYRISRIRETTSSPAFQKARGAALAVSLSTPEARKKLSDRSKRMWADNTYRDKVISAVSAAQSTPEYSARMAVATSRSWGDDDIRAKRTAGIRAAWDRPGAKETHSFTMSAVMTSDEVRGKIGKATRLLPPKPGSASRFKGVSFCKTTGRWRAKILRDGKTVCLGRYDDEADAARAYDKAAYEAWGNDCHLNFEDEVMASNDNSISDTHTQTAKCGV